MCCVSERKLKISNLIYMKEWFCWSIYLTKIFIYQKYLLSKSESIILLTTLIINVIIRKYLLFFNNNTLILLL